MHIIKATQPSVTLFSRDGDVWPYKTFAEAVKARGLRWLRENVGEHFRSFAGYERRLDELGFWRPFPIYREAQFIMRGDGGEVLTAKDLVVPPKSLSWHSRRYANWNGEGPVPYTGKRGSWRHYRRIKTTQERRDAQRVDDAEPPPRAARNVANVPNSWDDFSRASDNNRHWKQFRAHQWKA